MNTKACLRLTALSLLLPLLCAAAQKEQQIIVPNPCAKGTEFTLRVPFKSPPGMQVLYEWYRDGDTIPGTLGEPPSRNRSITYTIPADSAYGVHEYHFMYWLDDGCDAWTRSPTYVVSFGCGLQEGSIEGMEVELHACNLAGGGIEGMEQEMLACSLTGGGIEGMEQEWLACGLAGGSIEGMEQEWQACSLAPGEVEGMEQERLSCKLEAGLIEGSLMDGNAP